MQKWIIIGAIVLVLVAGGAYAADKAAPPPTKLPTAKDQDVQLLIDNTDKGILVWQYDNGWTLYQKGDLLTYYDPTGNAVGQSYTQATLPEKAPFELPPYAAAT